MGIKDYLPSLKGALNSFYDEKIKDTLETKSSELKNLTSEFVNKSLNYQKALLAVAVAIFLLLAIAYFWKEEEKK